MANIYSHHKRIYEMCNHKFQELRLTDKGGVDVTGPGYVVAPDDNGNPSLQVGWTVTVWLKHNKLIGEPDLGVMVPLRGVLPPDLAFNQVVGMLLENARDLRAKMSEPQAPPPDAKVPAKSERPKLEAPKRKPAKPRPRDSHFPSKAGSGFNG